MASVDTAVINRDCQWIDHTWPAFLLISSPLHKTQPYAIITFSLPANLQTNWITYLEDVSWNRNFSPLRINFLLTWLLLFLKWVVFYLCPIKTVSGCVISPSRLVPLKLLHVWLEGTCKSKILLQFTKETGQDVNTNEPQNPSTLGYASFPQ